MAHIVVSDEVADEITAIAKQWKKTRKEIAEQVLRSQLGKFSESMMDGRISDFLGNFDVGSIEKDVLRIFLLNLYRRQGLLTEGNIRALFEALPKKEAI